MEDLQNLTEQLQVSRQDNSIYATHPRLAMYKKASKTFSQEERREKFLKSLKESRYDFMTHVRNLAECGAEDDTSEEEEEEDMDVSAPPKKLSRSYKKQLMESEWMVEVPHDLATNWMMVPCPVATRCLVIATKFTTKAYYRSGKMLTQFSSQLPGGHRKATPGSTTILHCFVTPKKVFYILDVMCWNSHPVYDSDKEFRSYWLTSKYQESTAPLSQTSSSHKYPFHLLPCYSCNRDSLQTFLSQPLPFSEKLDGLLFFHKEALYIPGTNPLCVWLKPYMVAEMLGLHVPLNLVEDRPANYKDMKTSLSTTHHSNKPKNEQMQVDVPPA